MEKIGACQIFLKSKKVLDSSGECVYNKKKYGKSLKKRLANWKAIAN
jgi:hypothetical protein